MPNTMRKVVIASRNEDKVREMRELCAGLPFDVVSALDYEGLPEVIEDGTTALGNASRKAIETAAYTGEIAVADDTTFQVRVLNDMPDVFASRFAGPQASYADNVKQVLDLMRHVPAGRRQARFSSTVVWVDPRPRVTLGGEAEVPRRAQSRWLHNPFARAIEVKHPDEEYAYWNRLSNHHQVWQNYRMNMRAVMVDGGADVNRLREIVDRLVTPMLKGGRPADAPPGAVRLPDPRLWTANGPTAGDEPPTMVAPSGLPADAPGRTLAEAVWLEMAAEGRCLGHVGTEPVGTGGFGYDPIFIPDGTELTLAQLAPEQKHAISHRGHALRRLLDVVRQTYV